MNALREESRVPIERLLRSEYKNYELPGAAPSACDTPAAAPDGAGDDAYLLGRVFVGLGGFVDGDG